MLESYTTSINPTKLGDAHSIRCCAYSAHYLLQSIIGEKIIPSYVCRRHSLECFAGPEQYLSNVLRVSYHRMLPGKNQLGFSISIWVTSVTRIRYGLERPLLYFSLLNKDLNLNLKRVFRCSGCHCMWVIDWPPKTYYIEYVPLHSFLQIYALPLGGRI